MQLSERLQCVADLVTPGMVPADIGTDHGYVPIALVKRGTAPYAYAMDYREGPLLRAEEHIRAEGLTEKIATRLSDGFDNLKKGEAQTAILAGMGGPLVVDILKRGKDVISDMDSLILSPQSRICDVRQYILTAGYHIEREKCVYEGGKYYFVIKMIPREEDTSVWEKADLLFGKYLIETRDPVLKSFLLKEKALYEALLEGPAGESVKEKLAPVLRALERMDRS